MIVFDTSPLSVMLKHYYQNRFPTLWQSFNYLISLGEVTSVSEVYRELEKGPLSGNQWVADNKSIFTAATEKEANFVREILAAKKFAGKLQGSDIEGGNPFADPFVIAKAAVNDGKVVTLEAKKPHSASIPSICEHFEVVCVNLEEFMGCVSWRF